MRIIYRYILPLVVLLLLSAAAYSWSQIGRYPHKLWLHRCNTIEKLQEKHADYPHIEIDLVFREESGLFDVTHDEDKSYQLSLDAYFAYLQQENGKMWLDIKNLTETNAPQMLAAMNRLMQTYAIGHERLILESPSWQALGLFKQQGFYTSNYVTFDNPGKLTDAEVQVCIAQLQEIVDSGYVSALSFPAHWYREIRSRLHRDIDLLTWMHRYTQFEFFLTLIGHEMLNDEQLKVVLVKDKGHHHR